MTEKTSKEAASAAARVLRDPNASKDAKSAAGSALTQREPERVADSEHAAFEAWIDQHPLGYPGIEYDAFVAGYRAALQSQDREGWKEAAIAWEVCASLHRDYAKGRDPLFKTRQSDFVKHAEASREKALSPCSAEDKTDAERYRWLRNSAGFLALPYIDHGGGPEFPSGSELDAAIDHARRIEGES